MTAGTRAEEMNKRRQQLKVIVRSVSQGIAQINKEVKQRREPLQDIVQPIVQNTENKGMAQMVVGSIDENYKSIGKHTGATRKEEMKKRREQLRVIVQDVTKDIVQNKGASQIAEKNRIGPIQVDEISKSNTIKNLVATQIEEHTKATRNEEMKKRRQQLQGIVQTVINDIIQNKGASQIAKQNAEDSTNVDSESDTIKSVVSTRIEGHTKATRSEEMKKRREQLRGIVQSVTKDIVQSKGASQVVEQNGGDSTNVDSESNTIKSIGSSQLEDKNDDSESNMIKNIVSTRIEGHTKATRNEEIRKRREQLRGLVESVTKDIVQNKGASQVVEQNGDDTTYVDSESNTPRSIGSSQFEEMNGDSDVDTMKSVVAPWIEETGRKREEVSMLVQKVSEDVVQNKRIIDPKDIIREGFLLKQSKFLKQWRKRWFVLTSTCLYAFKKEGDKTNPTEFIYLDECSSVNVLPHSAGQNNVLVIDTPDRTLLLSAPSAIERDAWTESVNSLCILSMVVGRRLGRGRRLSGFSISEEDESGCEIEDDRAIKPADKEDSGKQAKPWDLGLSEAALFELLDLSL